MAEEYYSFEDVLKELSVDEEELKRMVSEGELRAFRSENKMKFKAEDVENLKKGRTTEPTVILPSAPTPPSGVPAVDETALELDLESELGALKEPDKPAEPEVPAAPAETQPGLAEAMTGDEPMVLDESAEPLDISSTAKAPDETFAEEEEVGVGTETEPLKFADEPETAGEVTEEAPIAVAPAPAPRRRVGRRVPTQIPEEVEAQLEKRRAHWIWAVIMTVALISTLAYVVLMFDVLRFSTGATNVPSRVTDGVVRWTLEHFWEDPEWKQFHIEKMPLDDKGEPVQPPFPIVEDPQVQYHRDYDWISYKEPRRAMTLAELEQIREEIKRREMGEAAYEEEAAETGAGAAEDGAAE